MTVVYWVLGIIVLFAVWGIFKFIVSGIWEVFMDGDEFGVFLFLFLACAGLVKLFAL